MVLILAVELCDSL